MFLLKSLKTAFFYPANLLLVAGGLALVYLSGRADVALPLLLAAEVAYLGLLGTHPRFQHYLAARGHASPGAMDPNRALQRMLGTLPSKVVERFEKLRTRCLELRRITLATQPPTPGQAPAGDEVALRSLDRLLWSFLRLLYTQNALERYLQKGNEGQIQQEIQNLEQRLQTLGAGQDANQERMRRLTVEDLAATRERLANYQKARGHAELVAVEIDRLETRIQSLSEQAIQRRDTAGLNEQMDQAVAGLIQTEHTMTEVQFATGLEELGESAPPLVSRQAATMRY